MSRVSFRILARSSRPDMCGMLRSQMIRSHWFSASNQARASTAPPERNDLGEAETAERLEEAHPQLGQVVDQQDADVTVEMVVGVHASGTIDGRKALEGERDGWVRSG